MPGWASLRLGKIGSIQLYVNITWLAVFALLVYWVRTGYVPATAPGLGSGLSWVVSVVGALVVFVSVVAHELAHSLVALRNGLPIRRITLFIFGGIAHMESEPQTPSVELKMALAGPLTSLGIAGLLGLVRFVGFRADPQAAPAVIVEYGTYVNIALAGFNLVPGFPLDGGRVLRAILWRVKGDFVRSTVIAATVGRVFALGLVFTGTMLAVAWEMPGFLWPALVGSFLERLAAFSAYRVRMPQRSRQAPHAGVSESNSTWHSAAFDPPVWESDQDDQGPS